MNEPVIWIGILLVGSWIVVAGMLGNARHRLECARERLRNAEERLHAYLWASTVNDVEGEIERMAAELSKMERMAGDDDLCEVKQAVAWKLSALRVRRDDRLAGNDDS